VINIGEMLNLDAVKLLQGKHKEVFDFISLFTTSDLKDFTSQITKFSGLISSERLTMEDVFKKMQYI